MMRPEDVDAEWVEKAARHRFGRHLGHYPEITWESVAESIRAKYLASAADYLAAVLPEIQAQALREFSVRLDRSFDHIYDDTEDAIGSVDRAEGYRHRDDQVNALLASAMQDAARLTATPEGPTDDCGSCAACDPGLIVDGKPTGFRSRMNVCPDCGNKRCPKAANHAKWQCTGSNAVGQVGVPIATGGALRNWRDLSTEPDPREQIITLNPKEPTT